MYYEIEDLEVGTKVNIVSGVNEGESLVLTSEIHELPNGKLGFDCDMIDEENISSPDYISSVTVEELASGDVYQVVGLEY